MLVLHLANEMENICSCILCSTIGLGCMCLGYLTILNAMDNTAVFFVYHV
uniref:Uncharacterized protein n=1 Tax=Rhizophora mucronata TaxID=61149 RepID=A0A2P2PJ49_RHIMU